MFNHYYSSVFELTSRLRVLPQTSVTLDKEKSNVMFSVSEN